MKKFIMILLLVLSVAAVGFTEDDEAFYKKRKQCFESGAAAQTVYAEASTDTALNSEPCIVNINKEIFDMLTPELIEFYELYIAKQNIISGLKKHKLDRLTQTYKTSVNKMYALIILQNIALKNKKKISLSELSEMSNAELIMFGKEEFTYYVENLSESEKKILAEKFEELKKKTDIPNV